MRARRSTDSSRRRSRRVSDISQSELGEPSSRPRSPLSPLKQPSPSKLALPLGADVGVAGDAYLDTEEAAFQREVAEIEAWWRTPRHAALKR